MSKAKGSRGEREVVELCKKWWNDPSFVRAPESGALSTMMEGYGAPEDVVGRLAGDVLAPPDFPFCVESKFYKEIDLWQIFTGNKSQIVKWWRQVRKDAKKGNKIPLLTFKMNRRPRMVAIPDWVITDKPYEQFPVFFMAVDKDRLAIMRWDDFTKLVTKETILSDLEKVRG